MRRLGDEVSRALATGQLEPPPLDPPTGNWDDGGDAAADGHAAEGATAEGSSGGGDARLEGTTPLGSTGGDTGAEAAAAAGSAGGSAADPQTGAHPSTFPKTMAFFFTAPRDVARVFRGALATVQRRIERKSGLTASESEALDAILEHDLWNRTSLCVWHHQRGEHAKILRCRGRAPGKLRFELGLRAGRAPLARYRSGDVLVS